MAFLFTSEVAPSQRRGMQAAIVSSVFKVLSLLTFSNGVLLLFFTALGLSASTVMFLLSLVNVLQALLLIPAAWLSDLYGPRWFALRGIALCGIGFACLPLAAWLPREGISLLSMLVVGIGLYGTGVAMQLGGWYSLLAPVVPTPLRGRFFGVLRVTWQAASILFAGAVTLVLGKDAPVWMLQVVLFLATAGVVLWGVYYARIPEVAPERQSFKSLPAGLLRAARSPGYAPFCAYVFVIQLFTGSCLSLFGLVEKHFLGLGGGAVVLLANLTMIGAALGYWLGGWAVDRLGTKPIFLLCHFGFGTMIFLFLFRDLLGMPMVLALGGIHFFFGLPLAASSIAISTEMMALAPTRGRSLFTSLLQALSLAGVAISGVLAGWGLRLGLFSDAWLMAGRPRSSFDAVLIIQGIMILAMTVTLGLVPSVLNKARTREWPAAH